MIDSRLRSVFARYVATTPLAVRKSALNLKPARRGGDFERKAESESELVAQIKSEGLDMTLPSDPYFQTTGQPQLRIRLERTPGIAHGISVDVEQAIAISEAESSQQ